MCIDSPNVQIQFVSRKKNPSNKQTNNVHACEKVELFPLA